MIQANIDLSGLRDLHLPVKPSVFPLAYGWWVLLGSFFIVIFMSVVIYKVWQHRPVVYAKHELTKIAKIADDKAFLKEVSILLRRVAMKTFGRATIAPLSDKKWQDFLMEAVPKTLTADEAHLVAFSPYETKLKRPLNRVQFVARVQTWMREVLKKKKGLDNRTKK